LKVRLDFLDGTLDDFISKEMVVALLYGSSFYQTKYWKFYYEAGARLIPWLSLEDAGVDGVGRGLGVEANVGTSYLLRKRFYTFFKTGFVLDRTLEIEFSGGAGRASLTRYGYQMMLGLGYLF
jgi:hypothetical protein